RRRADGSEGCSGCEWFMANSGEWMARRGATPRHPQGKRKPPAEPDRKWQKGGGFFSWARISVRAWTRDDWYDNRGSRRPPEGRRRGDGAAERLAGSLARQGPSGARRSVARRLPAAGGAGPQDAAPLPQHPAAARHAGRLAERGAAPGALAAADRPAAG